MWIRKKSDRLYSTIHYRAAPTQPQGQPRGDFRPEWKVLQAEGWDKGTTDERKELFLEQDISEGGWRSFFYQADCPLQWGSDAHVADDLLGADQTLQAGCGCVSGRG